MIKVLFVCMGNICRSPMAEAVFNHMIRKAGLTEQITVDSAGTGGWHVGDPAHPGTLKVLEKNEIPYDGRARQTSWSDLYDFHYVLAMDRENLSVLERAARSTPKGAPSAEIGLFLSYAKTAGTVTVDEVSDPYYHGRFDDTFEIVVKGCAALLDHIRKTHNL